MSKQIIICIMVLMLAFTMTPIAFGQPTNVAGNLVSVVIGKTGQSASDVTVTENTAGALASAITYSAIVNNISETIETSAPAKVRFLLPPGVTFTDQPIVSVTSGDLLIGSVVCDQVLGTKQGFLDVPIKSSSTTPSTIKIGNIHLTVDRTVPEGTIYLKVEGTAVDQTIRPPGSQDETLSQDPKEVAAIPIAVCTASSPSQASVTAVFKIGDDTAVINGTKTTLDTKPYLNDGSIMLSLRTIAHIAGIGDDKIAWGTGGNITIIKNNQVIKLTIGSKVLQLNNVAITMDSAPEIEAGHTMLPLQWFTQIFGADTRWDAIAQTATVTL